MGNGRNGYTWSSSAGSSNVPKLNVANAPKSKVQPLLNNKQWIIKEKTKNSDGTDTTEWISIGSGNKPSTFTSEEAHNFLQSMSNVKYTKDDDAGMFVYTKKENGKTTTYYCYPHFHVIYKKYAQ